MSSGDLKEILKEVKLVREKVERLEELVEGRLVGSEEPSDDDAEAIKEYMKDKKKGSIELTPIEDVQKGK